MFCKSCGAENPDDGVFCQKCGASLSASGKPVSAEIESAPSQVGVKQTIMSLPIKEVLTYGAIVALVFGLLAGILFDEDKFGGGTASSIFQWLMWGILAAGVLLGFSALTSKKD